MKKILIVILLVLTCVSVIGCNIFDEDVEHSYQGDLVDGYAEGEGAIYQGDKIVFEGNFEDGVLEGEGIYYENEVPKYEGEFKNGIPFGRGKFYEEGKLLFKGDIIKNEGEEMVLDGILYNEESEPFFSGEITMIDNELVFPDYGKLLNPDGTVFYEGELEDGMPKDE